MIKAHLKKAPAQVPPAEPAAQVVPKSDSDKPVKLVLTFLDGDVVSSRQFTFPASKAHLMEKAIETAANDIDAKGKPGRPGAQLICCEVNKGDPDFVGGEYSFELGEVVPLQTAVVWFNSFAQQKLSAPLVQYHLKTHSHFKKSGYTFRLFEDFKKSVASTNARDFDPVAEAHVSWCAANDRTPFE